MNSERIAKIVSRAAAVCALVIMTGCADTSHSSHSTAPSEVGADEFAGNDSSRAVWQAVGKQAALAQRESATLTAADFDGPQLNGLGHAHLDAMMSEQPGPSVVYLDLSAQDNMTNA